MAKARERVNAIAKRVKVRAKASPEAALFRNQRAPLAVIPMVVIEIRRHTTAPPQDNLTEHGDLDYR